MKKAYLSWHGRPARAFAGKPEAHGRGARATRGREFAVLLLIGLQLSFILSFARGQDVPAPAAASAFRYLDVFIDTHGKPLAAYQFELVAPKGVQLVGIEGGEHKAFAQPPYYDPKALIDGERIVIAAFDTGADLPAGKTRVARLSVRVEDRQAKPEYQITLQVAASSDAKPIEGGTVSVTEGVAQ